VEGKGGGRGKPGSLGNTILALGYPGADVIGEEVSECDGLIPRLQSSPLLAFMFTLASPGQAV
jgi:hypothetical protein